jgi:hypothetical protein
VVVGSALVGNAICFGSSVGSRINDKCDLLRHF